MKMPLFQAANAMNAHWGVAPEVELPPGGACIDSRVVQPGDLFFCVPGERVDGHDFAQVALDKGALAVVAQRPLGDVSGPVLLVDDTVRALGRLAAFWRSKTRARVVGVTGSAGKTTLKEWIAAILSLAGRTAWNHLNLNNQIGLPMSMLRTDGREEYWVFEAGISQRHDMDELGEILRPDMAVILNVGPAHLEGLGDVSGVARCKSRLLAYLQPGGRGLVSRDYPELREAVWGGGMGVEQGSDRSERYLAFTARENVPEKGTSLAPYRGRQLGTTEEGLTEFRLVLDQDELIVALPMAGAHITENLIAAAGCAHMLGVDVDIIRQGLEIVEAPKQRFQVFRGKDWTLIDDSYNANPLSMAGSLSSARSMAGKGPLYLVLGEMRELGGLAGEAHRETGRIIGGLEPEIVYWKGGRAEELRQGLSEAGYKGGFEILEDDESFVAHFTGKSRTPGVILFKGSRSNELDRTAGALRRELDI